MATGSHSRSERAVLRANRGEGTHMGSYGRELIGQGGRWELSCSRKTAKPGRKQEQQKPVQKKSHVQRPTCSQGGESRTLGGTINLQGWWEGREKHKPPQVPSPPALRSAGPVLQPYSEQPGSLSTKPPIASLNACEICEDSLFKLSLSGVTSSSQPLGRKRCQTLRGIVENG